MKERLIFLILFFLFNYIPSKGQNIDNKLNLYFSGNIGSTYGSQSVSKNDVRTPALFSNFKFGYGYALQADYKIKSFFRAGFNLKTNQLQNWELNNSSYYGNPLVKIKNYGIFGSIQTKHKETGLFNIFSCSIGIGSSLNKINVKLEKSLIHKTNQSIDETWWGKEINTTTEYIDDLKETTLTNPGIFAHLQLSFDVKQYLALFIQYNINYIWTDSIIFLDESITNDNINVGFKIKLMRDKQFYL